MLRLYNDQPDLWETTLPRQLQGLPPELAAMDLLLRDAAFTAPFEAALRQKVREEVFSDFQGRPSTFLASYVLREPLRQLLPNEQKFIRMFDLFEYLLGLVHLDLKLQTIEGEEMLSAPIGSFAWRQNRQWIDQEDLNWNLITLPLLNGYPDPAYCV